jgi:integrase
MKDRLVEKGLSGATIHACKSAASAMLKHAVVDLAAISRNPCRDLERGELPPAKRQTEPRYLSVAEAEDLLSECSEETRPVVATNWSGMRVSEACSLRWRDLNFEDKTIAVPGTKSQASKATVPLLPALEAELRAHRERQGKRSFSRIQPDALVFATKSGKPKGRATYSMPSTAPRNAQGSYRKGRSRSAIPTFVTASRRTLTRSGSTI